MTQLSDMDVTVCQRRVDSGQFSRSSTGSGGQKKTKVTVNTNYLVIVSEKSGGPTLTPSDINPILLMTHDSLPKTGRTCYTFGGLVAPFILCNNKSIERDRENPFVFNVSASWESIEVGMSGAGAGQSAPGQPDRGPEEPLKPEEPKEQELVSGDSQRVAVSFTTSSQELVQYESNFANDLGLRQSWKLPTGTPFSDPVVKKVPLITISLVQFEDDFTLTNLEERSYSVNETPWNGRGANQWLIGDIAAEEVTLSVVDPNDENELIRVDKWRISYNIHLAPKNEIECIVDDEPQGLAVLRGSFYNPGWLTLQPLVDTFFMKPDTPPVGPPGPDYLVPNVKDGYASAGYIFEANGRKRTPASSGGSGDDRPSYMAFQTFQISNFDKFLQWPK